jgi:hypothetical protein
MNSTELPTRGFDTVVLVRERDECLPIVTAP